MATFKAVVFAHQKRADGTYNVKIRVTHHRQSRCLPTSLNVAPSELTRSLKFKPGQAQLKADTLVREMQQALATLNPFAVEEMDVDGVVAVLRRTLTAERFSLDFFAWSEDYIAKTKKNPRTAERYRMALNAWARFIGSRTFDINGFTLPLLQDFIEFRRGEPLNGVPGAATEKRAIIQHNVASLAHLYHAAQAKYNDEDNDYIPIPKNPFARVHLDRVVSHGTKPWDEVTMQQLIDFRSDDWRLQRAADYAVISFALMGANLVDLYDAQRPRGDVWEYHRRKTTNRRADEALMRVMIPQEIEERLERWRGEGYRWLDLSKVSVSYDTANTWENTYLARVCESLGIPRTTFYSARKTFATTARRLGIEKATIDECLCHVGDYRVADIYIERNWELLWQAQRRVLDSFSWERNPRQPQDT